jgi:hypothetical protein
VRHFDGQAWASVDVPTVTPTIWPQQVRGSGRDDVWIEAGALMHWDGQRWSQADRGGDAIWVNAPDDVWLASPLESILEQAVLIDHWDGTTWTSWYFPHNEALPTLWSPGRGEVWVAASPSLRYRDGGWQTLDLPTAAGGFWGSSTADVWAFGWLGNGILRRKIP